MPDLLLELFSEEIPARMQARAAEDLRKAVTDRLVEAGLPYDGAKAFVTPRRLALHVQGVPARQPDRREEKKGPRVGAPEQAIAGFLKAAGLKSVAEAKVQADKKGDFYIAVIEKPGGPALEVISEILPEVIRTFPWPKSMRWGAQSGRQGAFASGAFQSSAFDTGSLRWVRPLHSILATFAPETEDPDIVPFTVDGIAAGNTTRGHRFLAPQPFTVRRLADYSAKLDKAKVVLDAERRRDIIATEAKQLAFAQRLELVEDEGLLAETAGLVEWPVVLMGTFDESFLQIPQEVIRATIRNNQKCFVLRDAAHAKLVNKFLLVANLEAEDGGAAIVAGNERVIRARLSDARFFYQTDLKTKLEDRLASFNNIIFHEKLGTQAERIERIERLAGELAPLVGADVKKAKRAARLCKADLLTEMIGEFPELQGTMGKYYAQEQGEDEAVAHAIEDHYRPKGPDDLVPSDPVSVAVALADKLDTLVGFWAVGEKPTGSKDPFALRRAALGVIRIVLDNSLRLRLLDTIVEAAMQQLAQCDRAFALEIEDLWESSDSTYEQLFEFLAGGPYLWIWKQGSNFSAAKMAAFMNARQENSAVLMAQNSDYFYEQLRHIETKLRLIENFVDTMNLASEERMTEALQGRMSSEEVTERMEELKAVHLRHRAALEVEVRKAGEDLLAFFADRLKVQLREQGARHDLVDAVFSLEGQDDLLLIVRRVDALGKFLETEDGKNLLIGYRRAANILRDEEKKDNRVYSGPPDQKLLQPGIEEHLWNTVQSTVTDARHHVALEDFESAMETLSTLRSAVDAFFDKVTVNVDDRPLRENRLKLLNQIREATRAVADFSKIEG